MKSATTLRAILIDGRLSAATTSYNSCLTRRMSSANTDAEVLLREVADSGVIELNRPKVLNALNLSMVNEIYPVLKRWQDTRNLVLIKAAGDKAFCAGGDIKSLVVALNEAGGEKLGQDFFRREYTLNHLIGTFKKPYVALIHGITMGGGVGLSVHGKYRVATEKTVFAMPETAIGLFPDVGGSYFLPRLKGKLGLFFGLTGYRLKGADVAFAGVATHYTTSDKLESLTQELTSRSTEVDQILEPYLPKNLNHQFCLAPYLDVIDECFSAPTVEEIISKLEEKNTDWTRGIVETLNKVSPTSLKVTKRAIEEGASKTLAECLRMEYRLACACLTKDSDFAEGVRALLIDKDQNPKWKPKKLSDVSDAMIDKRFAPLSSDKDLLLSHL
ncbi:3-hydroxyisobutyryl-CoA hydrolase, mitochondrial-like isoform X3 [Trichogramma pretiosum]|nr:3-hydroxyisobutyryl-CoA hydrolase, mitochondrial-like isoform X3 [Trichogramma pretiosum]XP_023314513.1 3-hydroxyisobutyryl-CoA hydrolase, mitochondrial-like isoform X3 [Trichogramma pretiosum]